MTAAFVIRCTSIRMSRITYSKQRFAIECLIDNMCKQCIGYDSVGMAQWLVCPPHVVCCGFAPWSGTKHCRVM